MARGWESKSVESQQAEAEDAKTARAPVSAREQQISSLQLTRKRLTREIEASTNPRFRELKGRALAHLDAQIEELSKDPPGIEDNSTTH